MKRISAILLSVLILMFSINSPAIAAGSEAIAAANTLYSYGLFKGTGVNSDGTPIYDLDRVPTRQEAIIMLVRLLGKEGEALSGSFSHPFIDVDTWASKYVGYAYQNRIANGIGENLFGASNNAEANMYITFVLRSLGYSDSSGDFSWSNPYDLADSIGLTKGRYNASTTKFLREDVAIISKNALGCGIKNNGNTLLEYLTLSGVVKKDASEKPAVEKPLPPTEKKLTASQVSDIASPSIFYIEVFDKTFTAVATGSGFFIDAAGIAVTNYHVIESTSYAQITTTNGKKYDVTHVIYYDKAMDVALLRISRTSTDGTPCFAFPFLTMADSSAISNGQVAYAIGSPLGLQNTISDGIISNTKRTLDSVDYIQTTAAISAGSSGGALLNEKAEVIGITSAGFKSGENLGLAIPINVIKSIDKSQTGTPYQALFIRTLKITAYPIELTIDEGSTKPVNIMLESKLGGDESIYWDSTDDNVAVCSWGDWTSETICILNINAVSAGTTYIKVFSDVDKNDNSQAYLKVTVTKPYIPTYKHVNVATYTYITGRICLSTYYESESYDGYIENGTIFSYQYSEADVLKYTAYLRSIGFEVYKTSVESYGYSTSYTRGYDFIAVTIATEYNEVWIGTPTGD